MSYSTQKFNIVLPTELVKKVDEQAQKEYRNRSELIREALKAYLQEISKGREIHGKAEEARLNGNFEKALELIDQALVTYQKEKDVLGFAEGLGSKVLTLRQLYDSSKDKNYLILAKHTAESAVEIARESGNVEALALPLENLAKTYEDLGDLKSAVKNYQEAIENMEKNPYKLHDRPALVYRMKVKKSLCEYYLGKKNSLKRAEVEAQQIEKSEDPSDRDKYSWFILSLLGLSVAFKKEDSKKSKEYLERAKEIIESDKKFEFLRNKLVEASSN